MFELPTIQGVIDRRVLANYRVRPEVLEALLPEGLRPQLVNGWGIAGICLIRLKHLRPSWLPFSLMPATENAAHRFAVEWSTADGVRRGVYIPRRDTNSRLVTCSGGRLFPGVHHHASFDVHESATQLSIAMRSDDGSESVSIVAERAGAFTDTSAFGGLREASTFFEQGRVGFSPGLGEHSYEGIELACDDWSVSPLRVLRVHSSYFENTSNFPHGTVEFDHALLMQEIPHRWHVVSDFPCGCESATHV